MGVRVTALLGTAVATALLVPGGVGAAVAANAKPAPRTTLRIVIAGDGEVFSRSAGIDCLSSCKVRVKRGRRVVLRAAPADGSRFAGWSGSCGTSPTCATTVSRPRVVTATFEEVPPPPPPPPPGKPGHYDGTYSDGTYFKFDVDATGQSLGNIAFDYNGECPNFGTSYGYITEPGPFAIQSDGSFSVNDHITFSNQATAAVSISGKVTSDGAGSGSVRLDLVFPDGVGCMSTGTWTAHAQ